MTPSASPHGENHRPGRIGPYEVRAELGRGAMGIVYEAMQDEPGRTVALKVLQGGAFADAGALALFRREIRALARLDHPGVATLYASGTTPEGLPYFAMELVRGRPLDVWRRGRPRRSDEAETRARLGVFLQICDAVAYAHQRGVLHRDLKPSNIVVLDDPLGGSEAPSVKVLDFGLARIVDGDRHAASFATEFGTVRGTLAYMSPEQVQGDPDAVDARADVYALGIVLYELLAGEHPLDLESAPAYDIPRRILDSTPKPIGRSAPGARRVDPDLSTIALKAMEKDPGRRYPTVQGLADDIRRYLAGQPITARPPSAAYQIRKLIRRHQGAAAAVVGAFVLTIGFAVTMAVLAGHLKSERDRANREADAARAASVGLSRMFMNRTPGMGGGRWLEDPEIATRTIEDIDRQWGSDPDAEVELLRSAGLSIFDSGGLASGIRLLERAAEIDRARFGDAWAVQGIGEPLGECYHRVGRLEDAAVLFRDIVERLKHWSEPVHPRTTGYALEDLGCVLRDLGRFDEAERALAEARRIYTDMPVPPGEWMASIHDSLGTLALARGDLERAEADHRRAFEIRAAMGSDSMQMARSRLYLGLVLLRRGKLDEAEPLILRGLATREGRMGGSHPDVGTALVIAGELETAHGRLSEAQADFDRAARIFEGRVAPAHPDVVMLRRDRETLARLQGR